MPTFMSDEWFREVNDLSNKDFEVPAALKGLTINLSVVFDGDTKQAHLSEGKFQKGLDATAPVTVHLPSQVAKKIFVELDPQAGMQAFMSGQMRVDGDPTKLMALQSAKPTAKMQEYYDDVQEITE